MKKDTHKKPLFILGNPRSGTSLLRLILTQHPQLIIPPESGFFVWFYDDFTKWNETEGIDLFLDRLMTARKFETWGVRREELSKFIHQYQPCNYAELIAAVYLFYGFQKTGMVPSFWGDKNRLYPDKLQLIREVFPAARFIHIVRDGRDVAVSYKELNKNKENNNPYYPVVANELEAIATDWVGNLRSILSLKDQVGGGGDP